jgi:hypothetical protein
VTLEGSLQRIDESRACFQKILAHEPDNAEAR